MPSTPAASGLLIQRRLAVRLLQAGFPRDTIAEKLGVTLPACEALLRGALSAIVKPSTEHARAACIGQLDALITDLWHDAAPRDAHGQVTDTAAAPSGNAPAPPRATISERLAIVRTLQNLIEGRARLTGIAQGAVQGTLPASAPRAVIVQIVTYLPDSVRVADVHSQAQVIETQGETRPLDNLDV